MNKMFPIQSSRGCKPHPTQIPWSVADMAYSVYPIENGRGQSLERLAERGGFSANEMDELLPDWREKCSEIVILKSIIKTLLDQIGEDPRAGAYFDNRLLSMAFEAAK